MKATESSPVTLGNRPTADDPDLTELRRIGAARALAHMELLKRDRHHEEAIRRLHHLGWSTLLLADETGFSIDKIRRICGLSYGKRKGSAAP